MLDQQGVPDQQVAGKSQGGAGVVYKVQMLSFIHVFIFRKPRGNICIAHETDWIYSVSFKYLVLKETTSQQLTNGKSTEL